RPTFTGSRAIAGDGSGPGNAFPGLGVGGGIANTGNLTIANSTFTGNQAIGGNGGSGGTAPGLGEGGGVFNQPGGALVVNGCTFAYNQAIGGLQPPSGRGPAQVGGDGRGGLCLVFLGVRTGP